MEVIAVSNSLPSIQIINGRKTKTSIVRNPSSSIRLNSSGVEDNDNAAHNAPIYVHFSHHYDYWTEKLKIERDSWKWCHWGENITFKSDPNLTDADFHLGDTWKVGESILQVCGARLPCYKLAWRCGQDDGFVKEAAESGRCGIYFRILKEGIIRPGDKANLIEKTNSFDIASITRFSFGSVEKDILEQLVENSYLLDMNKTVFHRRLTGIQDKDNLGKNSWKGWKEFKVNKIVTEYSGVKSFYLTPEDGIIATYLPGQFLSIKLPTGLIRNWSISDWSLEYYRITVKDLGTGSKWMYENCTEETKLMIRSPAGGFFLDWTPAYVPRQIYISAGIGITPIITMLKAHTSHFATKSSPAIWIHVGKVLFENEVNDKIEKHIFNQRPTFENIKELLKSYKFDPLRINKPMDAPAQHSTVYICGPKGFEITMRGYLERIGMKKISSERFSIDEPQTNIRSATIRFKKSNIETIWSSLDQMTLLQSAEQVGLKPDYGCRSGACGTCETRLLQGAIVGSIEDDRVLICCSKPASLEIELDL